MNNLTPADTELRTINTATFARYVGNRIVSQRGLSSIADTFCAVLRERSMPVESPERLAAWANCASKLILDDTQHESESNIASRAVRLVLKHYFGDTLEISGARISGESGSF